MSKTYQKKTRAGQPATPRLRLPCPEQVIVSMAQITESGEGGPAGLRAGTSLQMTAAMSGEDRRGCAGRTASTAPIAPGTGTAPRPGRSPWTGTGCQ